MALRLILNKTLNRHSDGASSQLMNAAGSEMIRRDATGERARVAGAFTMTGKAAR